MERSTINNNRSDFGSLAVQGQNLQLLVFNVSKFVAPIY